MRVVKLTTEVGGIVGNRHRRRGQNRLVCCSARVGIGWQPVDRFADDGGDGQVSPLGRAGDLLVAIFVEQNLDAMLTHALSVAQRQWSRS